MQSSLPARISPEGFLESIPELIVEIKSKNDAAAEIAEKVADYLGAGARLIWVCDDAKDVFTEHRPGQLARTIDKDGVLTCDDIIPGFRLSLADCFVTRWIIRGQGFMTIRMDSPGSKSQTSCGSAFPRNRIRQLGPPR